jgi:hypothetical protein
MSRPLRGNLAIFAAMRCPMRSVKKANRSVTSVTCQKCESNYHAFLPGAEGNSGAQSYLIRRCCVNRNRCRTWLGIRAQGPTGAVAAGDQPPAMMTGAKGLPTSHYDDYDIVVH